MNVLWSLLGQAGGLPKPKAWDPRILWTSMLLVAALLLGALIIAVVSHLRKRQGPGRFTSGDQLSHFRELYEEGKLSPEEYERIRSVLGGKLRTELKIRTPHPELSAEPPPPAPPPPEPGEGQAGPG